MKRDRNETTIREGHVSLTRDGVEYSGSYRVTVINGKIPQKWVYVSYDYFTKDAYLSGEPGREEDSAEGFARLLLGELVTEHGTKGRQKPPRQ